MSLGELTPGKLKILQAVATLLEDPGAKITISKIAKSCHVTDAAIYRHYKSKSDIFEALLSYMEGNFLTPLEVDEKSGGDTIAKIEEIFNNYMDFIEGHPGLARLFLGSGATEAAGTAERIKLLHAKIRSELAQLFRQSQTSKDLATTVEPEQATEIFYGIIAAAAMAETYEFPQISVENRWNVFKSTILR